MGEIPLNRNAGSILWSDIVSTVEIHLMLEIACCTMKVVAVHKRTVLELRSSMKIMTITFGSILLMKIRRIKKDANDVTLAIPSAILPGQKAAHSLIDAGKHYA